MEVGSIDVGQVARKQVLTMRCTGVSRYRARVWLGVRLLWLARWVMGMQDVRYDVVVPRKRRRKAAPE
jgi:hypothetical protein